MQAIRSSESDNLFLRPKYTKVNMVSRLIQKKELNTNPINLSELGKIKVWIYSSAAKEWGRDTIPSGEIFSLLNSI